MQKPVLEDFGLTKEDITDFNKQMLSYENECLTRKTRHGAIFGKYLIASIIVTCACFVAAVATFATLEKGNIWGGILTAITVLGVVLCYVLSHLKDHPKMPDEAEFVDADLRGRVDAFKAAASRYRDYVKLSKKEFWQGGGENFKDEVAKLFVELGYAVREVDIGVADFSMTKDGEKTYLKCECDKRVDTYEISELERSVKEKAIYVSLRGFKHERDDDKVVLVDLPRLLRLVDFVFKQ